MEHKKRLIDLDASLKRLEKESWWLDEVKACIRMFLAKAKLVDAVEVVHGEWEITEDDYFDLVEMKCSVCGESYGFEDYEDDTPKNYHYCPNCGAKMDVERKDNVDRCVCCGAIIPEGQMVCPNCLVTVKDGVADG